MPPDTAPLLEVEAATVHYGKVAALKGISLRVPPGGIITIVGANGAGKTTTLRAISGLARLSEGTIRLKGNRIDGLPAEQIVAAGIAQVPEGRRIFSGMTVRENLLTGAFLRRDKAAVAKNLDRVFERFPRLRERQGQLAKTLSGGEQQMLAIGRALLAAPQLLLLDEPSMGLSPVLVQEMGAIIRDIAATGVPVVLVEQNADLALGLATYAYVLETGRVALEGPAHALRDDPHVRRAYLGG